MIIVNKKAFTLVELLAVITILGIIALITVPNVINIVNDSKSNIDKRQEEQILKAAKLWAAKNVNVEKQMDEDENEIYSANPNEVTIATLINQGYLEDKSLEKYNNYIVIIQWDSDNNQLNYTLKNQDTDEGGEGGESGE